MAYLPDGQRGRPRPPLTKRMRRGHWVALDCVAGAIAALGVMVSGLSGVTGTFGSFPGRPLLAVILAAAVFVPVGFRRLWPVPAYAALILLAVLLAQGGTVPPQLVLVAAGYVLYVVTVEGSGRTGVVALALGLALAVAIFFGFGTFAHPAVFDPGAVPVAFVLLVCWMAGHAVRQRRQYAEALQHQAASKAVTEERLRIARELHDVVAHSMSVIAVQAGFGQYVIDSNPGDAREALGAIQATSRDALEEMRRMLGVLRHQDAVAGTAVAAPGAAGPGAAGPAVAGPDAAPTAPAAPLAPTPGLSVLDRLIERTSGTGVQVTLERSGAVRDVPAGVDLSAYRIVQEALTNSVKHAGPDASCVVSLRYSEEALFVEVTDDGGSRAALGEPHRAAPATGGHGIIGMRERAALCGGTLEAGPMAAGGFRVAARLPLHPAATLAGGIA